MTDLVKYTVSPEQIEQLETSKDDILIEIDNGNEIFISDFIGDEWKCLKIIRYMICNPHPLADMICQWARTGQPVYFRMKKHTLVKGICSADIERDNLLGRRTHYPFSMPDIYEYRFTPFED